MDFLKAMELAHVRHAELLEQAAQHRLAGRAAGPHGARRRRSQAVQDAVMALRVRGRATLRSDLLQPADLTSAAETA
jgi:hypothetical protein